MNNFSVFTVTLYANIISCIMLFGLYVLSKKNTLIQKTEGMLFRILLLTDVLMAVFSILLYGILAHVIQGNNLLITVLYTGMEISVDLMILFWLVYVNYRVYHSIDHILRNWIKFMAPALVFFVIDLLNAFTGFLFWYDEDIVYHATSIYDFVYLLKYAMFFGAILELIIHKSRKLDDMKFFSIWPFLIPTIIGLILSEYMPYYIAVLGFATGYTLLYAALMNECCYLDQESGFQNGYSLGLTFDQIRRGEYKPQSLIMIKTDAKDIRDFAQILGSQMIDGCNTYRVGEKTFLTLTIVEGKAPLRMLTDDISAAMDEKKYSCEMVTKLRKKGETVEEFIKQQLNEMKTHQ